MSDLEKAARQALDKLEIATLGVEEDCFEPECEECKPWRPVWLTIRNLRAVLDKQSTHADGCWSWGPAHYECACAEIAKAKGWAK